MHKNIQEFVDSFFFFLKCFFFKSWMFVPKQFTDKMNICACLSYLSRNYIRRHMICYESS